MGGTVPEETDESQQPTQSGDDGATNYQVVGTLKDPDATKPDWVADVVQVSG